MAFASLENERPGPAELGTVQPLKSEESADTTLSRRLERPGGGGALSCPLGRRAAQVSGAGAPGGPPVSPRPRGTGSAPAGQPAWAAPGWEVPRPPGRDPLIRFSHYIVRSVRQSKQHGEQSGGRGPRLPDPGSCPLFALNAAARPQLIGARAASEDWDLGTDWGPTRSRTRTRRRSAARTAALPRTRTRTRTRMRAQTPSSVGG